MKAVKLSARSQEISVIDLVDTPDEPMWKLLGENVGGWWEVVRNLRGMPRDLVMVVHEAGLLQNLFHNKVASHLYRGELIVGNVLFMREGMTDEGPDFVPMTDEDVDKLVDALIGLGGKLKEAE